MKTEFIPYEESVALKELGFDEPCFGYYVGLGDNKEDPFKLAQIQSEKGQFEWIDNVYHAPTFSQCFRWFRKEYGLYHTIWPEFYKDGINFNWQILWYLPKGEWTKYVISDGTGQYGDNGEYPSQEEAELACLNKLIKIIKNGK
jgi:hypothetical protein